MPLTLPVVRLFSWLPAYRVLMVWLYERTHSLLLAMPMHASLVATTLILMPVGLAPRAQVTSILVWALLLWLAVAVIGAADRVGVRIR